ncbi:MAG TPA: hypothetical protein VL523_02245 [Terriglobia bacterium]|nr:hypothetical protein [Terriglobia bacterium]
MLKLSRKAAIVFLASCVCAGAAQTGPSQALGQIVSASSASIAGVAMPGGGTLVSGNTLSTAAGGAALVKFSANGQVELSENTSAAFSGTPGHVLAKISQGALVATAAGPEALVTETSQCRIQPQGPGGATYAVNVSSSAAATVTARQGTLVMVEIASGRRRVLAEGETVGCPLLAARAGQEQKVQPAPGEQAGQAAPSASPAHSHTGLLVLLLGGGAAAGAGIALGGHGGGSGAPASPSAP